MGLSVKLGLGIAAVVAVCAAVGLEAGLSWQEAERREELRASQRQALDILALAVAPALAAGDHEAVQAVLDNIANYPGRYPDVRALQVLDRAGGVVADLDPRRFGTSAGEAPDAALEIPIKVAHRLGALRAVLDDARVRAALGRLRLAGIGGVVALALLLVECLRRLLRRVVVRRVEALAGVAERLGRGDLDARAAAGDGDELARLGTAFNDMAAELAVRRAGLEALVADRTQALAEANARLLTLATTDPLTGLLNRRAFEEQVDGLLQLARRGRRSLAVVLADVDHFKRINDTLGHAAGDLVLVDVARVLREGSRGSDVVARHGGEELVVAMPDTTAGAALCAAERLRAALAASCPGGRPVTASFGVATFPEDGDTLEALIAAADRALCAAKAADRDRVVAARDSVERAAG